MKLHVIKSGTQLKKGLRYLTFHFNSISERILLTENETFKFNFPKNWLYWLCSHYQKI